MSEHIPFLTCQEELPRRSVGAFLQKFILFGAGVVSAAAAFCALLSCFGELERFRAVLCLVFAAVFAGVGLIFYLLPLADRVRLAAVLAVCFAARLVYLLLIPTDILTDFWLLYNAAEQTAAGDMSWAHAEGGYFYNWAYQIPFVLYQAGVLKVFGSVWALKIFNLLFMAGIDLFIYLIARCFFSGRAAACAALLYAVWPGSFHTASLLTNQHIAAFFTLWGLYTALRGRRRFSPAAAGVLLSVGNLMRPEGIVSLAAVSCCCVCLMLSSPGRTGLRRIIFGLVLLLGAYFLTGKAAELVLTLSGLAPHGIGNNVPEWKFVLGLDFTGPYGGYSDKNEYILAITDSAVRRQETVNIISQSFRECESVPGFFLGKIRAMWGAGEDFSWSMYGIDTDYSVLPGVTLAGFRSWLTVWEKGVYILVWLLSAVSCFSGAFGKKAQSAPGKTLCAAMLCLAFGAYLLIEVQTRYRYFIMPLVFCLAAGAFDLLRKRSDRRDSRR